MPYAILRFKKTKMGAVSAAYKHNERKKEDYKSNPDIDVNRNVDNYHLLPGRPTAARFSGSYRRQDADCVKIPQSWLKRSSQPVQSSCTVYLRLNSVNIFR